jgi:hypothetical protein
MYFTITLTSTIDGIQFGPPITEEIALGNAPVDLGIGDLGRILQSMIACSLQDDDVFDAAVAATSCKDDS